MIDKIERCSGRTGVFALEGLEERERKREREREELFRMSPLTQQFRADDPREARRKSQDERKG